MPALHFTTQLDGPSETILSARMQIDMTEVEQRVANNQRAGGREAGWSGKLMLSHSMARDHFSKGGTMETPNEPIVLSPGEGRTFPFGRRTMITKADEEDTEDMAIFETMPEPGVPAALPHRHWEAVEAFYVLDGEMEFLVEERIARGTSCTFVLIPRGVVHGFRNPGPGPAKMLVLVWPARGLRLVKELGARLSAGGPPDPEQIRAIFAASHSEEVHDGLEQWR